MGGELIRLKCEGLEAIAIILTLLRELSLDQGVRIIDAPLMAVGNLMRGFIRLEVFSNGIHYGVGSFWTAGNCFLALDDL